MIEAAIFDMDGLLIDSEVLWTIAEIEVFGSVGIELDEQRCRETVGLGLEDVVEFRFRQQPWREPSRRVVAERIHVRVRELILERGRPMPGAIEALAFARARGARIGLATASDRELIDAFVERLGLRGAFDHLQPATELAHGKPHPEVYLVAAARLGVAAGACLALEDSLTGLIAAKAAGMKAIAVPDPAVASDPRFALADVRLRCLEELNDEIWRRLS